MAQSVRHAPRYLFVSGGVISGVGKGIASASIAWLLRSRGYRVTMLKCDPYVNVDAGTMNPLEHGETFVLEDGLETDMDIGHYERFTGYTFGRVNYMTTGSVYLSVIERERQLGYQGKCVSVIPEIPNEIIRRINKAIEADKADVAVIEIGGTVGEYESYPFLEANRLLRLQYPEQVFHAHVSYLPVPGTLGEMKTKPTQISVRTLNSHGIQPSMIIARSRVALDDVRREKISTFCNINKEYIVSAPDVKNIYDIPLNFEQDNLSGKLLKLMNMNGHRTKTSEYATWEKRMHSMSNPKKTLRIGMVAKYFKSGDFDLADSYVSVLEALKHAAAYLNVEVKTEWIVANEIEENPSLLKKLQEMNGILVPQGWGSRGVEGKLQAIKYARENKVPYLGLCFGMQMAVIEYARNVAHLDDANTEEANPQTPHPVIHIMEEQKELLQEKQFGGTIRLGAYPCHVQEDTVLYGLYDKYPNDLYKDADVVMERHRHRYEFNNDYREILTKHGLVISGLSPDNNLVEAIELPQDVHPFFVATQFHPELKSRFLLPHPIFIGYLKAMLK